MMKGKSYFQYQDAAPIIAVLCADLSYRALQRLTGINYSFASRIVRGQRRADHHTVAKLARFLRRRRLVSRSFEYY